jgi:uncharacterized membrane protein YhhN
MTLSPRQLRAVFLIFALLFVALLPFYPHYPGGWAVKAIPALSLAMLTWRFVPGIERRWLSLALLFSAAGDAVLGWNDLYGGPYFVIGLVLFLVAHVFFIVAFATRFALLRSRIPVAALLTGYSALLTWFLWPNLGEMALPVLVYIVVITVMAIVATLRTMRGNALVLGALAFMLSDSLLAVNRFWTPVPAASYWIITSYYFAQYMIAHAFVGHDGDSVGAVL